MASNSASSPCAAGGVPPTHQYPALILAGSPRPGGNSDLIAKHICAALRTSTQEQANTHSCLHWETLTLRDFSLLPCTGCGARANTGSMPMDNGPSHTAHQSKAPHLLCPLSRKDKSSGIIDKLMHAPALCIVSPIYNYHVPAGLKMLLDRLQPFWESPLHGSPRPCYPIFVAGRPKGEKLFAGSLLTYTYALKPLGFSLQEPLLLRGVDAKGAVTTLPECMQSIHDYTAYMRSPLPPAHDHGPKASHA